MKFFAVAALASLAHLASAVGVSGQAEGFAAGVTGGGKIDFHGELYTCADSLQ